MNNFIFYGIAFLVFIVLVGLAIWKANKDAKAGGFSKDGLD